MIDGDVAGVDPADAAADKRVCMGNDKPSVRSHSQTRRTDPNSAKRANTVRDRDADSFIRMEAHLAILVAPHEAHGKAAA